MKMDEIERYDNSTEKHYLDLSNQIAEKIIREYKKVGPYINIKGTSTDGLLYNYFKLKKKGKNQALDKILIIVHLLIEQFMICYAVKKRKVYSGLE